MARIRTIKPEIWTDEKFVELSAWARLLFIGLWNFADDDGRMEFSPKSIKMKIFPADSVEITELFGELRRENLVNVYAVDNKEYLQVVGFAKHQKVDKRSTSKHPPPPSPTEPRRTPPTEKEGKGKGGEGTSDANASGAVAPQSMTEEEKRKDCYVIARRIGRPSAPTELFKTNMPLDEVHATLLEAESAADPGPFLAKVVRNRQVPQSGHRENSRGVVRDRPRPVREVV